MTNFVKRFYCAVEGDTTDANGGGAGGSTYGSDNSSGSGVVSDPFLSSIPESYRSSDYATDILRSENPSEALWSKFHGMHESLKTQPTGMPSIDAPAEEWSKWTTQVAPKDTTVYGDVKPILSEDKAHLKEVMEQLYSPDLLNPVMEAARVAGVQPYQFKAIVDAFNNNQIGQAEAYLQSAEQAKLSKENADLEAKNKLDADFDNYCTQKFGNTRQTVVGSGFEFLAKHVDPVLADSIKNLPNDALAAVAMFAHNVKTKYEKEDRLPNADGGVGFTGNGEKELKSTINDVMSSEAYSNPFHAGHDEAQAKIKNLSSQLARITQPRRGY
jgi:hypothetical protein